MSARVEDVFLHSLWRSGSTYAWNKFRSDAGNKCFYEPLHERVDSLTKSDVRTETQGLHSSLHHPKLKRSYFYEFADLLRGDGVAGFERRFSYADFYLEPEDADDGLAAYIGSLIDNAERANRRAVLGFCRSTLRAGWMARRFPGLHVAIFRDAHQVWNSMAQQANSGNYYFVAAPLLVTGQCRNSSLFSDLRSQIYVPYYDGDAGDCVDFYKKYHLQTGLERSYFLFYSIWLASALHCLSCCQLTLDMDLVSADSNVLNHLSKAFADRGFYVDLSDCAMPLEAQSWADAEAVETAESIATDLVAKWIAPTMVDLTRVRKNLASLTDDKQTRLNRVLDRIGEGRLAPPDLWPESEPCGLMDRFAADLWHSRQIDWSGSFGSQPINAETVLWCSRLFLFREPSSQEWIANQLREKSGMTVKDYRNMVLRQALHQHGLMTAFDWRSYGRSRVTSDVVIWCYRLLLLREPESAKVVDTHLRVRRYFSVKRFVKSIMRSAEYQQLMPGDLAQ
jgi:hypothetical protein